MDNVTRVPKLCLRELLISETDLEEVLGSVDSRLRECEIDLSKNERPREMLEILLWLELAYCPELRLLRFACMPTNLLLSLQGVYMCAEADQCDRQMRKVDGRWRC